MNWRCRIGWHHWYECSESYMVAGGIAFRLNASKVCLECRKKD